LARSEARHPPKLKGEPALLDQAIKTQLKAYLERLTAPVELAASHD
jgi:hypothetical protein